MAFAVLIPVCKNANSLHFRKALRSVVNQSLPPDEILIVEDGPLKQELYSVIDDFKKNGFVRVKVVKLDNNYGLGTALAVGLENCSYEIVARMDSDDISVFDRFEKQVDFLKNNPDVDIVGSYIVEFAEDENELLFARKPPLRHAELVKYAKRRSPINHVTAVYRKSSVMRVGNYSKGYMYEDWRLWAKMLKEGCVLANIPEYLVKVRIGNSMYRRRGGLHIIINHYKLQRDFLKIGFIKYTDFIFNIFVRSCVMIMPIKIRGLFYKVFLRSSF